MHGLTHIISTNNPLWTEEDRKREDVREELMANVALLRGAPQLSANERALLHYSEMLLRVFAGESLRHVAGSMGTAEVR